MQTNYCREITDQMERGAGLGRPYLPQLDAVRLLIDSIPSFEVINYNDTESEAV